MRTPVPRRKPPLGLRLLLAALLAGAAAPAPATQFGVYLGAGCAGRNRLPAFEAFAGRRVEHVVDFLNGETWAKMDASIDWIAQCWRGVPVDLTLSVPMLPRDRVGTLRAGAQGAYDDVFRRTAAALVRENRPNAVVRIGWEFNGDWMPWKAASDPKAYIAYYRRIVRVMRAQPGQRFRFEWCPNHGRHALAPTRAYPGDDVVDVVGLDLYNDVWNEAFREPHLRWAWFVDQPYGLRWHRDFAAAHRKPLAYPEWGSGPRTDGHSGGDDPVFIDGMAHWFVESRPMYQAYWEWADPPYDDRLMGHANPRSAAVFRRAFAIDQ